MLTNSHQNIGGTAYPLTDVTETDHGSCELGNHLASQRDIKIFRSQNLAVFYIDLL